MHFKEKQRTRLGRKKTLKPREDGEPTRLFTAPKGKYYFVLESSFIGILASTHRNTGSRCMSSIREEKKDTLESIN